MATTESGRKRLSIAFFLGLFAAIAVGYLAIGQIRHVWNARHPAVSEHRGELVEAAAKRMHCGPEALTISVEEPTRARVEGCGHAATFRWGRVRRSGLPEHWREIDPNCRVDYMGCSLPCD